MPQPGASTSRHLAHRWAQLVLGLAGWGLAVTLMVRAALGVGPWDALHVGISEHTGIGVGTASITAGLAILAASLFVGVRPGVGTVANMVLIGLTIDLLLPIVPEARGWIWGLAYLLGGIGLAGWFTGMYVAAGLGKGPRDGLVLALSEQRGWSVRSVRTWMELSVLVVGWALGGPLGVGTLIYAVTMGPSMQWGLRRWGLVAPSGAAEPEASPRRTFRRRAA